LSSVHARSESAASASHGGNQDRDSRVPDGFDLLTYLTGEPGPDVPSLRVGDPVELRVLRGGLAIEAFSAAGQRIGRLPPAERDTLAELLPEGHASLPGHIDALLPRPGQWGAGRIHIRVRAI
jgi:hypothetical protein